MRSEPVSMTTFGAVRHDWTHAEVCTLFALPFPDLMFHAQSVHRRQFEPCEVQISTLLSIKTGGCPEDCAYCPQSARYATGVKAEKLMEVDTVLNEARAAKSAGASRRSAISTRSARWSPVSKRSGSRPAPRAACSPARRPVA